MGLSSFINVTLTRGEFQFIPMMEAIVGSPIVMMDENNQVVNLHGLDYSYFPKDGETKHFFCHSLFPTICGGKYVISFSLSAQRHIKTEAEKEDKYANGIDFELFADMGYPYKDAYKDLFLPYIGLCKLYGYSKYHISSEFDDTVIEESFDRPPLMWLINDNAKYCQNKNAISLYILDMTGGRFDGWEKTYPNAYKSFTAIVKKDQARMIEGNSKFKGNYTCFREAEITYVAYSYRMYELRLLCMAWEWYKTLNSNPDWNTFMKGVGEKGYRAYAWDNDNLIPLIKDVV